MPTSVGRELDDATPVSGRRAGSSRGRMRARRRRQPILVVDDEDDIRKLLGRLLARQGHRVIEADRGLARAAR